MFTPDFTTGGPIAQILYTLLNGISEVPLVSAPLTGLLILIGTLIASRKAALMMVLGSLIGGLMGWVLGVSLSTITLGLLGFNSVLTAMALWSGPFAKTNRTTLLLSLAGAAITAVLFLAFDHLMTNIFIQTPSGQMPAGAGYAIPGFTSSFVFTTLVIMYATKRWGHDIWPRPKVSTRPMKHDDQPSPGVSTSAEIALMTAAPSDVASGKAEMLPDSVNPVQSPIEGFKWTPWEAIKSLLNGVSQVTFIENWKTGLLWVIGLTLSFSLVSGGLTTNAYTIFSNPFSPLFLAGVMALIGSGIGMICAMIAKYPMAEIRSGIHGYNQVLVMIALTAFVPLTLENFLYAVLATIVCSFFTMPAMQNFLGRWGIPPLTGPFVFTAWAFMFVAPLALNIPFGVGWGRP